LLLDEVISMLCERCGKGVAEVHLVKIFNGRRYEEHLCRSCAKEVVPSQGASGSLRMFFSPETLAQMQEVLKSLLLPMMTELYGETGDDFPCPHCGKIIPSEFFDDLESMISEESVQDDIFTEPVSEKDKLDLQMKNAVQDENYELAAKIRDRLIELKKSS